MTLEADEFIRRFLLHVLPKGFHRIRHYGLLANGGVTRAEKLVRARQLIATAQNADLPPQDAQPAICDVTTHPCPHCGSCMVIIERFEAPRSYLHPRSMPSSTLRINTS